MTFFFKIALLLLPLCAGAIEITRLRVEYLENPLGLSESAPRFSWILHSASQGARQSAYQILVSSDPKMVHADLWDSGKVGSDQTAHIEYAGKPLTSDQFCFWKVRAWDEAGELSESAISHWSMGLLSEDDWQSEWIGLPGPAPATGFFPEDLTSIYAPDTEQTQFAKNFELDRNPMSAQLIAVASGSFTLFLNERHVMTGIANEGQSLEVAGYLLNGRNQLEIRFANPAGNFQLKTALILPQKMIFTDQTWGGQFVGVDTLPKTWVSYDRQLPARHLRREFQLDKPVTRATLHLASAGLHEAWVNGVKVSDEVLTPGFSDFNFRIPAVTRDVTAMLKQGTNALGLLLGNGRYHAPRHNVPAPTGTFGWPAIRARLIVNHPDGSETVLTSDNSWRATDRGPIRVNNEYDGEFYDARRDFEGWASSGFDVTQWQSAAILPSPQGVSRSTQSEAIKILSQLAPQSIREHRPGIWLIDFGQNMTGWCRLSVRGTAGQQVSLRHGQRLLSDGSLDVRNLRSALATDHYILSGAAAGEVWEPRFVSHGFRYVELSGYPGTPDVHSLTACLIGNALAEAGTFESSSATLNRVIDNCRRTLRANYLSLPLDCADRDERQGWQGDRAAESRSETTLFDVAAIYTRWLDEIRFSQRPDGCVSDVAPAYWKFYSGSSVWPSVQTMMPRTMYLKYADRRILERHFEGNSRWVTFLLTRLDHDGLLPPDTYGDWCVPSENRKFIHTQNPDLVTDKAFMANAYLARHLELMTWTCEILGRADQNWETHFAKLAQAIRKRWWKDSRFSNGTQTSYALAHSFQLVPRQQEAQFLKGFESRIERDRHRIGTGNIGIQWIHTSLDDLGLSDFALQLATQKEYPGYGYMIEQGATTIWELWNGDTAEPTMNSANHIMMIGDLPTWCFERLAGIQPNISAPGYQIVTLRPTIPEGLSFVSATQDTIRGPITSRWKKTPNGLDWEVTLPANTQGELHLPEGYQTILEVGKGTRQRVPMIKITSGRFQFELQ